MIPLDDLVHAMLVLIGACFAAASIGASFVFGVALVCRRMKWAPINTTINVCYNGETKTVSDDR